MNNHFDQVRDYLLELGCSISIESREDETLVVDKESDGIKNLVLGVASPILIFEQYLFELNKSDEKILQSLLMKNRDMVAGAFVLDETGKKVIFRNTLEIENLDLNEVEGTLNSLSLLLSEYSDELIAFSKN